jgi:hypothetical protein
MLDAESPVVLRIENDILAAEAAAIRAETEAMKRATEARGPVAASLRSCLKPVGSRDDGADVATDQD